MEKGQTSDDVSFFLKSAHESKVYFVGADWIPGLSKRKPYGLLITIEVLI